ncbi:hypothetical protein LOK46_03745 [Methylobacterium sp. NMS14P]|uniref:hypothetical protein n=1 Tax=Methylobacterium sp. NMS14P TaxID=2894310 RepID=UPI002358519E|nr:hypothetical protein [Methylobacterium sp. NMS14P]WCS25962.1 hypothetical protein LOK46_03745 [Methylobacterium sp. NMS14P]
MAAGYVVAAFLEAAGLVGLVIAVLKMRTERQARAAELRSFLRSGQIPTVDTAGTRRPADTAARAVAVPYTSGRDDGSAARPSPARAALGRAFMSGGAAPRAGLTGAISAG